MEMSNRSISLIALAALLAVGAVAIWMTRPAYGDISEEGYAYAMALSAACNGKNQKKVERILQMIDESERTAELTEEEAAWLRGIAKDALEGNWEGAYISVRTLMEEQTRKADPLPNLD